VTGIEIHHLGEHQHKVSVSSVLRSTTVTLDPGPPVGRYLGVGR
jgi:hypothetical protein